MADLSDLFNAQNLVEAAFSGLFQAVWGKQDDV